MAPSPPGLPRTVKFGGFELDRSANKLFKGGTPIKLAPQPFKVLLLLLDRHGQVVSRGEIQRHLWGESTFVDFERGINFSINQIRAALSDDAERPRYIETLPKLGYRFVAAVTHEAAEPSGHAAHAFESEWDLSELSPREAHPSGRPPPTQAQGESAIQTAPAIGDGFADAITAAPPIDRQTQALNPPRWWRSP